MRPVQRLGGRPRGDVRESLSTWAGRLVLERGCFTGRDVAAAAMVSFEDARLTLKNMVTAGDLVVVGRAREPGISRPLNLYAQPSAAGTACAALDAAVRCWADFR